MAGQSIQRQVIKEQVGVKQSIQRQDLEDLAAVCLNTLYLIISIKYNRVMLSILYNISHLRAKTI